MSEPIQIIGCPPESRSKQRRLGIKSYVPPQGAIKTHCEQCDSKCWIGPMQQKAKEEEPETPVLCMVCAMKNCSLAVTHLGGKGGAYEMKDGSRLGPEVSRNN